MMEFIVNLFKNTKGIFLPRTVHHDELADDFFRLAAVANLLRSRM